MGWVIYFFGSGLAFFAGVGCVLAGLAASFGRWPGCSRVSTIAAMLGVILVALSGTPLSIGFYVVAALVTATWLIVTRFRASIPPRWKIGLSSLVAAVWIGGAIVELPHQMLPTLNAAASRKLYLFGDSITAGVSESKTDNWPQLLARSHSIELSDYSRAGATLAVALRRANDATLGDGIVLLEIGGNDLLGTTTGEEFDRDLEQLLNRVCQPGRQVLMFELPIPPLQNGFGQSQRRLTKKYHVLLIPKRILVGVLSADGATLDSIHLSARGHQWMAHAVWQIIGPAFDR